LREKDCRDGRPGAPSAIDQREASATGVGSISAKMVSGRYGLKFKPAADDPPPPRTPEELVKICGP
jgi:hypothetical protein